MNISGLTAALLLLGTAVAANAQVTVEASCEQEQVLPGESLRIAVRITNLSGQKLQLGGEDDWLTFAIESRDGVVVPKLGDVPVLGEFELESSKMATKRVDLAPYFLLTRPGTYQIVATVRIRNWSRELTGTPAVIDVIQGVKIWEQEVGAPKANTPPNAEPETRRYVLQQASYRRGQTRLYIRVTDAYGKPIRVLPLGAVVSFGRPTQQVDRFSNLHVLYQQGASLFTYVECSLDGEIIQRRTYEHTDSRPRLRPDDDGNIIVAGGLRRVSKDDVPPPPEPGETGPATNTTSSVAPPPPATTDPAKQAP